jgi:hypothetical protein
VRLYATIEGRVISIDSEPEVYASMLEIDPDTNAAIVTEACVGMPSYRLLAGQLYRDGQPVAVNPPSAATSERQQVLALVQTLKQFNGLNWTGLTTAQKSEALRQNALATNRLLLVLGRLLLAELRDA